MPTISIVDHRRLFHSLPPVPLLTDVTINDHLLHLSLFLSPLYIPSLASPSPFPISFSPLTTLPLLFPLFCFPFGLGWVEFNAPPDTIEVISEAVVRANYLTDTDKQNKWVALNTAVGTKTPEDIPVVVCCGFTPTSLRNLSMTHNSMKYSRLLTYSEFHSVWRAAECNVISS